MTTIPGIDVSRWQGEIDWRKVAQAGPRFAAIRATCGDTYTDPLFRWNWDRAREAGLLSTAYHVVAPERPPDEQIDRFLDALDCRRPHLPAVLDVELARGLSPDQITDTVAGCCDHLEQALGHKPIIYTGAWFWDPNVADLRDWSQYDLWVASYTHEPILPRCWRDWLIWQYTAQGSVPGIKPNVDLNRFNGDEPALAHLVSTLQHKDNDQC